MKSPLHILHLEDDPKDAKLVQFTLAADGITSVIHRVQTRGEYVAALERGGIDLILSDCMLPEFDGLSALKIACDRCPAVPLIFVSGTLGEERAIDSLKNGAIDYVLKDRLARLVPAVRRAMEEVEQKAETLRMAGALNESEQRLQTIFNESPLGIMLVGPDGRAVLTNAAVQKILGYSGEELNRMRFDDFTHPDDRAKSREAFQQFVQGGRADYKLEKRYIRKDGQVVWARISVCKASDAVGHTGFCIGMVEDVTEHRNLEAKFIEAQKMEVVGQLAGGVAHDFNNILAVIMGYSDLMTQKMAPDDELRSYVETIRSSAERAAGLTRQLLIFSRKQTVQPVVLDLNEVLVDLNKMLRRLIDENIELTIVPGKEIGGIKADSGYVGQVIMNLAVNARDAMPNGGKLTISAGNATLDEIDLCKHKGLIPGEYILLSVSDTGTGMTEEVKSRMFEAFFTTKPKGKGTGLGLATCHSIVQQCGGCIDVQTELGQGTTFRIYFPRVDQPLHVTPRNQAGPAPRGTETLLVVEDEPALRHLARSVLESHGYEVLSASNGQDALHTVRNHNGPPIRLVITDVVMPLMGGKAMAEWLKTTNPDLKILFTSGYTEDAFMLREVSQHGVEFLSKPYTPATLCSKVREMLDAK